MMEITWRDFKRMIFWGRKCIYPQFVSTSGSNKIRIGLPDTQCSTYPIDIHFVTYKLEKNKSQE
jgi:hypothetical protein